MQFLKVIIFYNIFALYTEKQEIDNFNRYTKEIENRISNYLNAAIKTPPDLLHVLPE